MSITKLAAIICFGIGGLIFLFYGETTNALLCAIAMAVIK